MRVSELTRRACIGKSRRTTSPRFHVREMVAKPLSIFSGTDRPLTDSLIEEGAAPWKTYNPPGTADPSHAGTRRLIANARGFATSRVKATPPSQGYFVCSFTPTVPAGVFTTAVLAAYRFTKTS